MGDRSLEYAQILLDNLSDWPEHIQLLSALQKEQPHEAYNAVKQLALSIEQSKEMFRGSQTKRQEDKDSWKGRSRLYEERQLDRDMRESQEHPR